MKCFADPTGGLSTANCIDILVLNISGGSQDLILAFHQMDFLLILPLAMGMYIYKLISWYILDLAVP